MLHSIEVQVYAMVLDFAVSVLDGMGVTVVSFGVAEAKGALAANAV